MSSEAPPLHLREAIVTAAHDTVFSWKTLQRKEYISDALQLFHYNAPRLKLVPGCAE